MSDTPGMRPLTLQLLLVALAVRGDGGDDRITSGPGNDSMHGGAGEDTLVWENGGGNDKIDGDLGFDTTVVTGTAFAEEYTVVPNGDRVKLDRAGDLLLGGLGNDTLTGNAGTDLLDGGPDRGSGGMMIVSMFSPDGAPHLRSARRHTRMGKRRPHRALGMLARPPPRGPLRIMACWP